MPAELSAQAGPPSSGSPPSGVLDEVAAAVASARGGFSNFLELLSLETRRASLALIWMGVCGFAAAVLAVAAWGGTMTLLGLWAVSCGVHPIAAVFAIVVLNVLAATVLVRVCIGLSRDLLFPATQRQLSGTSSAPKLP